MGSTLLGASKSLGCFGLGIEICPVNSRLKFSRPNLVVRDLIGFGRQNFRCRLKTLGLRAFRWGLGSGPEERCAYWR